MFDGTIQKLRRYQRNGKEGRLVDFFIRDNTFFRTMSNLSNAPFALCILLVILTLFVSVVLVAVVMSPRNDFLRRLRRSSGPKVAGSQ